MNDKINNSRKDFEKLGKIYKRAENVSIEEEVVGDVSCYWFNKEKIVDSNKLIIYLHGGCFVLGSIKSHEALVSHIAADLSLPILFVAYGLAPESPFPAAVNGFLSVYKYLLAKYPSNELVFIGDSAGAGLAVSVLSKINKEGLKSLGKMVVISPWVDLTCSNKSLVENAGRDPILTKKGLEDYASLYVNGGDLNEANPIENMKGPFPPTLILVGSDEILLDDSRAVYNKIADKQPKVKLSIYDKQPHVWILEDISTTEAKNTLREISEFIKGQ